MCLPKLMQWPNEPSLRTSRSCAKREKLVRISPLNMEYPRTLRDLKASRYQTLSVKDELRLNLIRRLRSGQKLFPGIVGYDNTVIPQLVNAILSRHNIILLGLRGQAKSRIIRQITELLEIGRAHV